MNFHWPSVVPNQRLHWTESRAQRGEAVPKAHRSAGTRPFTVPDVQDLNMPGNVPTPAVIDWTIKSYTPLQMCDLCACLTRCHF